jgi:CHAT domain-containing protein
MTDAALTLHFSREQQRLKVVSFNGHDKALRLYEVHEAAWEQIERTSREIFTTLQRANRTTRPAAEVFDTLRKSGQILFDLLIPSQAKDRFAATTATVLTLHLEDTLIHLPWELLHDGREFLCRRFAVGRIASTRQMPTARSIRTPKAPFKVLIIADPRGDLAGSYREGLEIKAFLDERRDVFHVDFKSQPVDISFLKMNLRDYDIVHYAGHADYHSQNPCESGWLLTDGKLRANDICTMGGHQPMPALVFANACRSGQTDEWQIKEGCDQEIFGLANAYLLSGVQHYVGTFWDITDEPSSHFAKRFYRFLAEGKALGVALREARQALINNCGEETLVWASYMLYGDPSIKLGASNPDDTFREKRIGWRRILPGKSPASAKKIARPSPLLLALSAVLLIVSIYVGYSVLFRPRQPAATTSPNLAANSGAGAPALATAVGGPLNLAMDMIGQRKEPDGSFSEVVIKEGTILRSGDQFQAQVEVNHPSYLYLLLYDSRGQASQLFPDPKLETPGFIEPGHKMAVPDKDLWFWLDSEPGTETIYTLASEQAIPDIHDLLSRMEKVGHADQTHLGSETERGIQITERGIGGVATGKTISFPQDDASQLQRIKKVTEVVASTGAVVRAISFEHR